MRVEDSALEKANKTKRNEYVFAASMEIWNKRKKKKKKREGRELKKGIEASIMIFRCVLKDSMVDRIDLR